MASGQKVTGSRPSVAHMIAREIQLTAQIAGVPDAFLSLLRGDYRGNVSVRLA